MKQPWKVLGAIVVAAMLGYFVYGMVRFPDSPIHPCGQDRLRKAGSPRALEDYRAHQLWQTGLMWGWPVGVALIVFAIIFFAGNILLHELDAADCTRPTQIVWTDSRL
jgi:hypothetical protein